MSSLKFNLLVTLLVMILSTCSNPTNHVKDQFQTVLNDHRALFSEGLESKKVLIVIPRSGCSGCIGIADNFFRAQLYDPNEFQFVFTKITSLKTTQIRLGKDILDRPEVFLDMKNDFSHKSLSSAYPIVCSLENGNITQLNFLDPNHKNLLKDFNEKISAN